MKRAAGFLVSLLALCVFSFSTSAKAETLSASVPLTPANEVPPITGLAASGGMVITVVVGRDSSGAITGGTVNFTGNVTFPGAVTIVGLHIHEGLADKTGPVVINTGLTAANSLSFAAGAGIVSYNVQVTDTALLARLLKNPAGFYVNLHTSVNTGGAIRGQIVRLEERIAGTVDMTTAKEIPTPTGLTASGVATITASPVRDDKGVVIGGTVTFSMTYDFPANTTLVGLHIHKGPVDNTGPVVINTGLTASNSIVLATGKGSLSIVAPINTATSLTALKELLVTPGDFYVNLHTSQFTGGAIRSQLSSLGAPPVIQQSDTYFLATGTTDAQIKLLATGIDLTSSLIINGQTAVALPDLTTGLINVTVPAALRTNAGTLFVQARTGQGLMSTPIQIVVAPAANVNTFVVSTSDAARFLDGAAPDSIGAAFGTKLASVGVSATTTPLPTSLDGTSLYINGTPARLFFVSPTQINFLIPATTQPGAAQVVITAKDGTISRGQTVISPSAPAIFTRTATGIGAPAAVASVDGQNFTITMGNPDGSPVPIDINNYVSLFGTGLRFASGAMTMSLGGTAVTPLFFGPQGQFEGLDQVNLQIPPAMAGKGDVDLTITIDGKTSNVVKLKIK